MARAVPYSPWQDRSAPSLDEIKSLASDAYIQLPETFQTLCGEIVIQVSDFATDEVLDDMDVQYAKAMGLHVIAVDIADDKLALATTLGADQVINATKTDPGVEAQKGGGVEGVLVTAVSTSSFSQGLQMLARGGTMSLVGLPPGGFELPIFDVVLTRKTIRGSIVGTRNDLAESLAFAAGGKVAAHYSTETLDDINSIFARMEFQRHWYLGFLGFLGFLFLPRTLSAFQPDGAWLGLLNALWFLWFTYFIPTKWPASAQQRD